MDLKLYGKERRWPVLRHYTSVGCRKLQTPKPEKYSKGESPEYGVDIAIALEHSVSYALVATAQKDEIWRTRGTNSYIYICET
jgi:hypothetical protein